MASDGVLSAPIPASRARSISCAVLLLGLRFSVLTSAASPAHPFIRGIGWSPWHATHGWGRPAEVVEGDFDILADLHVNALRPWGPSSRKGADALQERNLYLLPQVRHPKTPRMSFSDGKAGHTVFGAPESLAAISAAAEAVARELKGHPAVLGYNLGNEYSWVGQNKSNNYQHQGFDDLTLELFRASLADRFGTVENWNEKTGMACASFADVTPPTGSGSSLLYWEWWRFQREAFGGYLRAGHDACRRVDPAKPVTYALLCGGRWDAATEDAALDFLEIQGDNLYFHWGNTWLGYSVRLARRIGPGRPIYITETGINTWQEKDPTHSDRLMRQMLWMLVLHPEVKAVFPFVFCDEWWHGKDPKAYDCKGDAWGIVTADRKPKSTYNAVKETYAEFSRLDSLLNSRESEIELLVSDQVIDRWKGRRGPEVNEICDELYRGGVSFRLVSLLRPSDLSATSCNRLLLLDSAIPNEPDGRSPALDALESFERRGGEIIYISDKPWQAIYGEGGKPPWTKAAVLPASTDLWVALRSWTPIDVPCVVTTLGRPVFWRRFRAVGEEYLLIVASDDRSPEYVTLKNMGRPEVVSGNGVTVDGMAPPWTVRGLNVHALLRLGRNEH
ncbi:MAG: hypothetical protein HN742_16790 [Lentisphaerae bacterium]|nr:hypothetical protein [Lentisphaerota bacterium]MBT4818738.1 hypothetical protein [Lentisphaerota bacterium]MBT5606435.1 hypothetical protein [Lentisphaerota bacterium]MBT7057217.1 hypothetical protein [Lentisphaerota bacterium]MBT7843538.1 hypothetical protein [Lentisphaerota bacterium]